MAVKIRLARRGRKKMAMYDIVIAESTSPRDGRFIEKIGTYNPNTDPSTVVLKAERAVYWLMVGAQPTDTARSVLSHEGIMYRKHLQVGVNKGAITQEQADDKFSTWSEDKQNRKAGAADTKTQTKEQARTARLDAEKKVSEARAEAIVKKNKVEEPVAEEVAPKPAETAIADALSVAEVEEAHAADSLGEVPVELTAELATPKEAAPVDETAATQTPIADIAPADEVAAVEATEAPAEEAAPVAEVAPTETPAAEVAETETAPEAEPTPAPAAEAPAAETPAADEAPAAMVAEEAPAELSAPASEEAPAVETPAAEAPAETETPVAETPAETPADEAPAADDEKPAAK